LRSNNGNRVTINNKGRAHAASGDLASTLVISSLPAQMIREGRETVSGMAGLLSVDRTTLYRALSRKN